MFNPLNLEVFRLMFFCRGSLFFTTRGMCVFFVLRVKFFIPVTYFLVTGVLLGYTHAMDVLLGYTHPRTGYIPGEHPWRGYIPGEKPY